MVAVLTCGPGAVLSHRSAAHHLGLLPTARAKIDITVPRAGGRAIAGIDAHRSPLRRSDVTYHHGIPVTTVARTLLDLADVVNRRQVERAIDRAEQLRPLDMKALEEQLARSNGRTGAPLLRAVLEQHRPGSTLTRSELEELFLAICRRAQLPQPEVNYEIALGTTHVQADFAWPDHGLIVETDGYATHGTRQAFEDDRQRDQRLAVAGWRVVRFTWRQIEAAPHEVAATLKALLPSP